MGVVVGGALSTLVLADKVLTFPVPQDWSLEEAATVPAVYLTVLFALVDVSVTAASVRYVKIILPESSYKERPKHFNPRRKRWNRPSRHQRLPSLRP